MNKEKIKQFVDGHKAEIIITGLAAVTGLAIGLAIGKKVGQDKLVEELIHDYEKQFNGTDIEWPVFISSDKNLGELMYEIKAECIGD